MQGSHVTGMRVSDITNLFITRKALLSAKHALINLERHGRCTEVQCFMHDPVSENLSCFIHGRNYFPGPSPFRMRSVLSSFFPRILPGCRGQDVARSSMLSSHAFIFYSLTPRTVHFLCLCIVNFPAC